MATVDEMNKLIAEQNAEMKRFASKVVRRLKSETGKMVHGKESAVIRGTKTGHPHSEDKLQHSLGYRQYYDYGLSVGIGVKLERHGVFVHKGVGRGYIMVNGVVMRGQKAGKAAQLYAKQKNREARPTITEGTINRKPVEWFNPLLDIMVPELADRIAIINADAIVNATRMKIE